MMYLVIPSQITFCKLNGDAHHWYIIVSGVPYAPSGPAQEYFDWFLVDGQAPNQMCLVSIKTEKDISLLETSRNRFPSWSVSLLTEKN